jgi:hypothetical protein
MKTTHLGLFFAWALGACSSHDATSTPPDEALDGSSTMRDVSLFSEALPGASDEAAGGEADGGDAVTSDIDARDIDAPDIDADIDVGVEPGSEDATAEGDGHDEVVPSGNPFADGPGTGNPFLDATADSPSGPLFDPCAASPRPGFEPGPSGLAACCAGVGPAHCVPKSEVVDRLAGQLLACNDVASVCMPDAIIRGGGQYRPSTCTSSFGPGACVSRCIGLIRDNPQAVFLQQSDCGEGDLCVPCANPFNGTPTGACDLVALLCPAGIDGGGGEASEGDGAVDTDAAFETGADGGAPIDAGGGAADARSDDATSEAGAVCPYQGPPLIDPAIFPGCDPACTGAHCVPQAALPSGASSLLSACTSSGATPGRCAPDAFIASAGNYLPPACAPFAGTTAAGRCLSTCLPSVASQPSLEPSTCAADSKCVPCNDPFTGAETGACSIASCDVAPSPPFTFASCCPAAGAFDGRCVPQSQIPDTEEANLLPGTCASASLCVPNDLLPGAPGPAACTGTIVLSPFLSPLPYGGLCLSRCLNLGLFAAAPQGNCSANHVCMPCSLVPTAPGCQQL